MRNFMNRTILVLAVGGTALAGTASARADESVIICKESLSVPVAAAGCAAVGVLVHEIFVADRPFGPNGELMKVILAPGKIVDGNIKGATRERGEIDKVLRAVTGISIKDINQYDIWGGPNSIFRKPFG